MGRWAFRNYYKGHMDKVMGDCGRKQGREVGLAGLGARGGEKVQTIVI